LKNVCFSPSKSAVLLSLMIYQLSVERPCYFRAVYYEAA
jgi:hypothetical protein